MSKRLLTATTALASIAVAAAGSDCAAEEKIRLALAGYHQQWGVYANQDIDTATVGGAPSNKIKTVPVDQKHNSEICVIGETTLDGGVSIGLSVQIEANTSASSVDESYLYVQHPTYGQLSVGDDNNAGYLLHVYAPDGGVSIDSGDLINNDFWANTANQNYYNTAIGTTNLRFNDNDSGKFTYITPRFAGVQAGVSFIPKSQSGGDDNTGAYYNNTPFGRSAQGNNNQFHRGVAGGLNVRQTVAGVDLQLSLGAMRFEKGKTAQGAGFQGSELFAWNGGAQFGYAGLTVGGAWNVAPNRNVVQGSVPLGNGSRVPFSMQSRSWTVGAAYEWDGYSVGVDYMRGVGEGTFLYAEDTRLDQAVISAGCQLGPGIRLVGGVFLYDADAEKPAGATAAYTGFDNQGWGIASGLKLSF